MTKRIWTDKPASDEFLGVLHGGGGNSMECHCGRQHYAPHSQHVNEGEYDHLDKLSEEHPDDFIRHSGDFVEYKMLAGIYYVLDCPCNCLQPYENFVWENRTTIKSYLAMVRLKLQSQLDSLGDWSEDV